MTEEFWYSLIIGLFGALLGGTGAWLKSDQFSKKELYASFIIFALSFSLTYITQQGWKLSTEIQAKTNELSTEIESRTKELSTRIDNVGSVFQASASRELEEKFLRMYEEHARVFSKDPILRSWTLAALEDLALEFEQGVISMAPAKAVAEMGTTIFSSAEDFVFATNVGSLEPFLENDVYASENRKAWDERRVVVMRFYLYSAATNPGVSFDEYCSSIGGTEASPGLHENLRTVYSAAVNLDSTEWHPRDFLFVDDRILGEMLLTKHGDQKRGIASSKRNRLAEARHYFKQLAGGMRKLIKEGEAEIFAMPRETVSEKRSDLGIPTSSDDQEYSAMVVVHFLERLSD